MFKSLLLIILIAIFFFGINFTNYAKKTNFADLKKLYNSSQWVNPNSQTPMGDADLYAFAGISYLKGSDPTSINAEMPPLGKYFIGLITTVLGNQNISGFIFGGLSLVTLYFLAFEILKNKTYSFLISLFFAQEKIFREQLVTSLLDLPQLFFLLLCYLSFLKSFKKPGWAIMAGIALGGVLTTKVFFVGVVVAITIIIASLLLKFSRKNLLAILFLSFLVYLASYYSYFLHGHTIRDFLGFHKGIMLFYKNSLVSVFWGAPFFVLFFDRWETWFGKWFGEHTVIFAPGWFLTWPLATVSYLWEIWDIINGKLKKLKRGVLLLLLWSTFYLIFLFNTPIWPRYLLLLLPFLYIVGWEFLVVEKRLEFLIRHFFYLISHKKTKLLWFVVLVGIIILFAYVLFGGSRFLFTSSMVSDWYIAERIYQDKSLLLISPWKWPFYLMLTVFYLLFDGHPVGILVFATSVSLLILLVTKFSSLKQGAILSFLVLFLLVIRFNLLKNRPNNLMTKKMEIVKAIIAESRGEAFGIKIISVDQNDYSFPFLFHWYGVRQKNVRLKDIDSQKPKLVFIILINPKEKEIEEKTYEYSYYGQETARLGFSHQALVIKREL